MMEYYLAIKKEWNTDTCYNIDKLQKRYADAKDHIQYDTRQGKPTETKFISDCLAWGRSGKCLQMGTRFFLK